MPVGVRLLRIYSPSSHQATPASYREWGPVSRFDHQRPTATGGCGVDRGRGVLYAAPSMLCCVGEFFGDTGSVTVADARLARLRVQAPLRMLDVRKTAAAGAGTIHAIGAITQRATTQAWARWWYEHPQLIDVHGVLFEASHSGEDSYMFWERARGRLRCPSGQHWALTDPKVLDDLHVAAHRLRLPFL